MRLVALLVTLMTGATPAAVPTLGRQWAPSQRGYGKVEPRTISNGGDPTGLVERVRWTRWGRARALGRGFGYWVWPGLGIADGSTRSRAVVVAYDLGRCRGRLAYRRIQWFYPKYGGSFDPGTYINICTGRFSPELPTKKCGAVAMRFPPGRASQIEATALTCRRARQIVAASPSVKYLDRGGRFRHAGLYCGSEGRRGGDPSLFECGRGRIDILYEVSAP